MKHSVDHKTYIRRILLVVLLSGQHATFCAAGGPHPNHGGDEFYLDEESVNGTVDCGTYALDLKSSYIITGKDGLNNCVWLFLGTTDCYPTITCPKFVVKPSYYCTQDFLALSDGTTEVGLRFCGKERPYYATSQTSILQATLIVNSDYGSPQFECKVSCAKHHYSYNGYGYGYSYHQPSPPTFIPTTKPKIGNCECGEKGPITNSSSSVNKTLTEASIQIVGGTPTQNGEYRMFTSLVVPNGSFPVCGGTLITDTCVLTAAHCCKAYKDAGVDIQLLLNLYNTQDITNSVVRANTSAAIIHPLYDPNTFNNDVCVIKLKDSVKLAGYYNGAQTEPILRTMCLPPPKTYDTYTGKNATVIGFGDTSFGGSESTVQLKTTVQVISNKECEEEYGPGQIFDGMICAASPGHDTCQGDSGGPMMIEVYKRYMQIGITSFGNGCADPNFAGVYSRVTELNDWIRMTCRDTTWCKDLNTHFKYHDTYYN